MVPPDSAEWGEVVDRGNCDHRGVFRKALPNLTENLQGLGHPTD